MAEVDYYEDYESGKLSSGARWEPLRLYGTGQWGAGSLMDNNSEKTAVQIGSKSNYLGYNHVEQDDVFCKAERQHNYDI